mmetsp:Transcript_21366/g.31710  ORF Transcript_21366/g.31710 Transcript_21366/m.31710 type:complete len:162 (-) Transcript_21366:101-586(-)
MKKVLEAKAMQQLLNILLLSDTNGDFTFNEKETEKLMLRLRNCESLEIDEKELRKFIKKNNSVSLVMGLLRDMVHEQNSTFKSVTKKKKTIRPIKIACPKKFLSKERDNRNKKRARDIDRNKSIREGQAKDQEREILPSPSSPCVFVGTSFSDCFELNLCT